MNAPDGGPGTPASPAAMLTDVIGRTAVLDNKVTSLASDLAEFAAAGVDREAAVKSLAAEVQGIKTTLDALTAEPEDEVDDELRREAKLPNWDRFTDRAEAADAWERLCTWLNGWFVPIYNITVVELRPCWMWHPHVREQLSALRVAWVHAYRLQKPERAVDWHQRYLPEFRDWLVGKGRATGNRAPFASCAAEAARTNTHLGEHPYPPRLHNLDRERLALPDTWWIEARDAHLKTYRSGNV